MNDSDMEHVRIGGVSEHFNRPVLRAKENGLFQANRIQLDWKPCSGGTGQLMQKLQNGDLDLAIALTEGIVNHSLQSIAKNHAEQNPEQDEITIVSPYIATPLTWAVIVGHDQPHERTRDLEGLPVAVSRMGSGSHLMSVVLAERENWKKENMEFVVQGDFMALRKSVNKPVHAGGAGFFLWEYFTTKPFADANEVRMIDTIRTPWPCFMIAARKQWAKQNRDLLNKVLSTLRQSCLEFVNDPVAAVREIQTHYGLTAEDARGWLKSVGFAQEGAVEEDEIVSAIRGLHQVNVITDKTLKIACGISTGTESNKDKWELYSQAVHRVVNTSFVRVLPPVGENAIFDDSHSRSRRSGVKTADCDFGSIGDAKAVDEPSATASDSTDNETDQKDFLMPASRIKTTSRIKMAPGPVQNAVPGEEEAASVSRRNFSDYRLDAGRMAFNTQKDYEEWKERKDKALKLVESHIFCFGGIPTIHSTLPKSYDGTKDNRRRQASSHEDPLPS